MDLRKATTMQELKNVALDFVRKEGPILPVQLAKVIGRDITFSGAVLSEFIANKKMLISKGKIGGSPLYYVQGQESKLQRLEGYLNGREKEAFLLLKEKKLLRESDCEPWLRVALKEIQDFAYQLNVVSEDGGSSTFWKWYLLKDDEVNQLVSSYLEPIKNEGIALEEEVKPAILDVKPVKQDVQITQQELLKNFVDERSIKPVKLKSKRKIKVEKVVPVVELENYLRNKNIEILSKEVYKKGKEVDMVAYVPSELGKLKYFIAFRNKKRISDTDLSAIYGRAQVKGVHAILLSNGELTKKAKQQLLNDYKTITHQKLL